jgi:hypothetical protein
LQVHFGLGDALHASLEIRWPSGMVQEMKDISANQRLQIEEPRAPLSEKHP